MSAMYRNALLSTAVLELTACGSIAEPYDEPGEAPMIAITSPADGEPVSRLVMISADALADSGNVASVRFDLPSGTSVTDRTAPFSTMWDSTTVADGTYLVRVTATDDQGTTGTTSATFTVANERCLDDRLSAQDLPRRIPDANPDGIRSSIEAIGPGRVTALSLSLRVTHPFPPDLGVKLISPAGTRFSIRDADVRNDTAIVDNLVIHAFDDQTAEGTWTLAIQDTHAQDVGTLDAWSLAFATSCNAGSARQ